MIESKRKITEKYINLALMKNLNCEATTDIKFSEIKIQYLLSKFYLRVNFRRTFTILATSPSSVMQTAFRSPLANASMAPM